MIETIYSNESGDGGQLSGVQSSFKMPKNIRQVGKSSSDKRIYVEDYVVTFIKQLSGDDYSQSKVAVLVGEYVKTAGSRNIFISGAIEVENIDISQDVVFTNDIWTAIYEDIKKYFVEHEIVGWFLGGPGYLLEDNEKVKKIHVDNFAGQNKTLMTYDNMEKEEAFWLYEENNLVKQDGYYIYYDKNEDMQTYMVEHNGSESGEADYDDRVSREIRTVINNKKPQKPESRGGNRLVYAAGTLLAVIILLVAAGMLDNYEQMKSLQGTLDSLSENFQDVDAISPNDNDVPAPTKPPAEPVNIEDDGGDLDVEVLPGDVSPIDETPEDNTGTDEPDPPDPDPEPEPEPDPEPEANDDEEDEEVEVKYYTVAAGDTLAGISYKLYESPNYIREIMRLNGIDDENYIFVGQRLIVP